MFQSAPLTEARGDFKAAPETSYNMAVSIRSPHRSKGRPVLTLDVGHCVMSFNPLPSPKQGETARVLAPTARRGRCFNPLPSPKQGETPFLIERRYVSIRSPHRSKGRPLIETNYADSFNPLPSPKQGETYQRMLPTPEWHVFQSAPLTEARGPRGLFQSAPLTEARGAIRSTRLIRSPQGETCLAIRFQSAPLTEARGDAGRYNQRITLFRYARPNSTSEKRDNLLLCRKFPVARKQGQNALTSLSRTL